MVCYRKLLFPWKRGQKVKFGPKIGFFTNFSRTLHLIFFIFCMMLGTNKGSSAMYMVCYRKLLFLWKQGQKVKFGPKIGFFANFSGTLHLIFLIFCMMLETNIGCFCSVYGMLPKTLVSMETGTKNSRNAKFRPKNQAFSSNFSRTLHCSIDF